jgi:hypothetical protein
MPTRRRKTDLSLAATFNNQRAEFDHIQSATRTNNKIHPAVPFSNCHQAIKEGTHTFPSIPVQARNNQLGST